MTKIQNFTMGYKILLALISLSIAAYCAEEKLAYFKGLDSQTENERVSVYIKAVEEHTYRIKELMSVVNQTTDKQVANQKELAIQLLGVYRAKESVQVLAKNLSYLPPPAPIMSEVGPPQSYYPAAQALVNIGEPSGVVSTMVSKVKQALSDEDRNLAAWVIMEVQGREQALKTLSEYSEKINPQQINEKRRLREAINFLREFKPERGYPETSSRQLK